MLSGAIFTGVCAQNRLTRFPRLPQERPILYITLALAIYIAGYAGGYQLAAKNMQKDEGEQYLAKQKHQLKALEVAGEDERQEMLQETKKAVVFYDAAVHTGNEVLDTILTEKSVLCVNRNIRLSCMADTNRLEHMRVIDLYTMLGNAIDNAIECVDRFADDEKKVISLSVREQGGMLYISVENYFEGELMLRNGYPVTSKKDQANHGFGVKSIRMIAKRYGWRYPGEQAEPYFLLQIIIPAAGDGRESAVIHGPAYAHSWPVKSM